VVVSNVKRVENIRMDISYDQTSTRSNIMKKQAPGQEALARRPDNLNITGAYYDEAL